MSSRAELEARIDKRDAEIARLRGQLKATENSWNLEAEQSIPRSRVEEWSRKLDPRKEEPTLLLRRRKRAARGNACSEDSCGTRPEGAAMNPETGHTITVSLTRSQAAAVAHTLENPDVPHSPEREPHCLVCSAVGEFRAALDRESETPTQAPRKSPEPGPPITEEQVERCAEAMKRRRVTRDESEDDSFFADARACLEAARDA